MNTITEIMTAATQIKPKIEFMTNSPTFILNSFCFFVTSMFNLFNLIKTNITSLTKFSFVTSRPNALNFCKVNYRKINLFMKRAKRSFKRVWGQKEQVLFSLTQFRTLYFNLVHLVQRAATQLHQGFKFGPETMYNNIFASLLTIAHSWSSFFRFKWFRLCFKNYKEDMLVTAGCGLSQEPHNGNSPYFQFKEKALNTTLLGLLLSSYPNKRAALNAPDKRIKRIFNVTSIIANVVI